MLLVRIVLFQYYILYTNCLCLVLFRYASSCVAINDYHSFHITTLRHYQQQEPPSSALAPSPLLSGSLGHSTSIVDRTHAQSSQHFPSDKTLRVIGKSDESLREHPSMHCLQQHNERKNPHTHTFFSVFYEIRSPRPVSRALFV